MNRNNLMGLPPLSLNLLSGGFFILIVCLGVRVALAPELALEVANNKLVTSDSADKLRELVVRLEEQARVIKQKEQAYQELNAIYKQSLKGSKDYGRLQNRIEVIEELPEVDGIDKIKSELYLTEEVLEGIITE